ncbi:hypothetical protein Tco_0820775 [Tanacetum coccineum]|uniref:Uncharacterized protein n=1 Tax=Tanacetum coccineum TaxID=301880 RepID=A0ABQ5AB94_9ASTR
MTCAQHADKDSYSTSVVDIAVQSWFLDDQLTSLSPRNWIPPVSKTGVEDSYAIDYSDEDTICGASLYSIMIEEEDEVPSLSRVFAAKLSNTFKVLGA